MPFASCQAPVADRAMARRSAPTKELHPGKADCPIRCDHGRLSCPEQVARSAPTARRSRFVCSTSPPFSILNQKSNQMGIPQMKTPPSAGAACRMRRARVVHHQRADRGGDTVQTFERVDLRLAKRPINVRDGGPAVSDRAPSRGLTARGAGEDGDHRKRVGPPDHGSVPSDKRSAS